MKFKASYFSVSIPLIKENFRRFWAIPALGFLAYFLSSVFPILMSYSHITNMYNYIEMCLTNKQPFFMAVHLALPVIAAVIVFRYVQSSSSVTAMHSMPFTRAQLFNSNMISGLILILLPLLANELILQAIAKPTYDYYMYIDYEKTSTLTDNAINIFSRSNVLEWFWQSLLIVLVIYAISVFAGMITGNTVMHLALALGFNFLAPALYLTFVTYCSGYLFGFTSTGVHERILTGLSPFTQVFSTGESFTMSFQIYYITLTIVIIFISGLLYQKRQMEKSGDSIIFSFMIPAICYLIAYFGMSLMGYYFKSLSNSNGDTKTSDVYFYAGLIAGAIIAFIIGRMIVLKTPRIFNKQMIKSFGFFALIASLFICSITFDLMGFESRVPNINKVNGILSTSFDYTNYGDRYSINSFKPSNSQSETNDFYYSDPKNIEALIALHQDIVNKKSQIEKEQYLNVQTYPISLYYDISNPLGLQRSYNLTYKKMLHNPNLKRLYESLEFKKFFSFNNLNCEEKTKITLSNVYYYDDNTASNLIITDSNKISSLFDAMEQDFQQRTYEDCLSRKHAYCNMYLDYKYLDEKEKLQKNTLNLSILLTDSNTITWLKSNGYSKYLEYNADMVQKIVFTEQNVDKDKNNEYIGNSKYATEDSQILNEENSKQLIITDKKQIDEILHTYYSTQNNFDKYYEGYIVFKQINGTAGATSDSIYYDFDTAPEFISKYFK